MDILALSLNHRVTPLAVRESVAFNREEGVQFLRNLRQQEHISEAILLSTCNRTEIYVVHEPDPEKPPGTFSILDPVNFLAFYWPALCAMFCVIVGHVYY